jgi:rare lipoprotein A
MTGVLKSGRSPIRRLRALKRLRVRRRHIHRALMATTPTAALLGFGGMAIPKVAVPVAVAATALPATAQAMETAVAESEDLPPLAHDVEVVEASYYGDDFAGRPTANGEIFDPSLLTAAHRTLPFGTLVQVTEALSGKSVIVRINDRGPFHGDRAIDLSEAAAAQIGMLASGTGKVALRILANA